MAKDYNLNHHLLMIDDSEFIELYKSLLEYAQSLHPDITIVYRKEYSNMIYGRKWFAQLYTQASLLTIDVKGQYDQYPSYEHLRRGGQFSGDKRANFHIDNPRLGLSDARAVIALALQINNPGIVLGAQTEVDTTSQSVDGLLPESDLDESEENKVPVDESIFDPDSAKDAREKTLVSIRIRKGQPKFRKQLLKAFGEKCAITGCRAVEALEAAHILPYKGSEWNHASNGILLRADIHTLFDLGLIHVDSENLTVTLANDVIDPEYRSLHSMKVSEPKGGFSLESRDALRKHSEDVRPGAAR